MNLKPILSSVLGFCALASATPVFADSVTVNVLGTANPYLAGQPNGVTCCDGGSGLPGDSAPSGSPTYVPGTLTPGSILTFSGSGGFNNAGGMPSNSLDGDNFGGSLTQIYDQYDYGTGVAGAKGVNVNGLVGVFLSGAVPAGPPPAQLDYYSLGLGANNYKPLLDQIFWIGDGLTGLGTGTVQTFLVPTDASRLYLGIVDGCCWSNNTGSATVTVSGVTAVPGPIAGAGLPALLGFAGLGFAQYRRTRRKDNSALSAA